ncbi:2456_t:CDS:2 [Funneliformis mosseae]|uniref:2456_t:CDS:1 n=1 Tax=Funneliformis mosseae TaxID=27381 RepID=A0A9N8VFC3_FUNMO|nr:2456_t:CDS:2 [Funneliformis mosseae]
MLIKEDIRQKAAKLYEDFQQTWKSSRTTEYFKQLEIRYQTKRKLEVIESQKIIELAEIDRMKVSQLRNNTESVTKHVSDSFVEFTQENTRNHKRTLEDDESSFSKNTSNLIEVHSIHLTNLHIKKWENRKFTTKGFYSKKNIQKINNLSFDDRMMKTRVMP